MTTRFDASMRIALENSSGQPTSPPLPRRRCRVDQGNSFAPPRGQAAAWLSGRLGILSGNPDAATRVHREAHGGLVADAIHPVVEGQ